MGCVNAARNRIMTLQLHNVAGVCNYLAKISQGITGNLSQTAY